MNPRIQELAQEATEDILGVKVLNQQHFAELIVQECIDYCGENLSKTVGGALKIHFGVRE